MKKWLFVCSAVFMLAGCSSDYKTQLENGDKALQEKQYEKAIQSYGLAMKEKPDDNEIKIKFVEAKTAYFDDLLEQSKTLEGKKKYSEAKEQIEDALKLFPNRKTDVSKDIKRLDGKIADQKEMDKYEKWVEGSRKEYQDTIQLWRTEMTSASMGQRSKAQIVQTLVVILQRTDESVKGIENQSVGLDLQLAPMHEEYYDQGNEVYNTTRDLLLKANDPKVDIEDIVNEGKEIEDSIKEQLSYVTKLEKYKVEKGL